ncbi:hypothetical protein [Nocardia sp. NPDC059228]
MRRTLALVVLTAAALTAGMGSAAAESPTRYEGHRALTRLA